ncbi:uncharacterized protein MKK02DRAFT_45369 [Dioszegia hungarica]|uniref:DUF6534 domain-containing protein n=1 Tax=Dioszegia hungarica TaxID=4972 RepID=A0AA38HA46_9TREE|nr:uncharacterized protein MKK02DRAFT_45369 [Dioszegia hungarica]KAI9636663.1 hypothetical protein MKK02DRAFT_45369 [Dioszegia hungarica]
MIHHVLATLARRAEDRPISPITDEATAAAAFVSQQRYVLGCMFAPLIFDILLLGVFLMQVYTYFTYQKNDRWITKAVVLTVLFINLCFSGYHTYFIQWLFVENFGLWAPFFNTKRLAWGPFIDSLNSFVVQVFMSYRAYRLLNRQIWIPIVVTALCLTSIGATLSVLIIFSNLNSLIDAYRVKIPELLWLTSVMCADLIITISIIYGLSKSKTGWAHTDKTIGKLVRMTIEGQVPPFLIALIFMVEFINTPDNLLGATLQNLQCKFYAVGMMYSINARVSFQRDINDARSHNGQVFAMNSRPNPTQIQVAVETETYVNGPYDSSYPDNRKDEDSLSDTEPKVVAYSSQAQLTDPHRT